MAKSAYSNTEDIDGRYRKFFTVEPTNSIVGIDVFDDVETWDYTFRQGDRFDVLAAKYLSDDRYFWVIPLINNIIGLTVEPGTNIKIPYDIVDVLDRI